jgi:hypothetical protein
MGWNDTARGRNAMRHFADYRKAKYTTTSLGWEARSLTPRTRCSTELPQRLSCIPLVLKGVRRTKLPGFPYLTYYRVLSDRVEVIAVLHGSRDPSVWQGRI